MTERVSVFYPACHPGECLAVRRAMIESLRGFNSQLDLSGLETADADLIMRLQSLKNRPRKLAEALIRRGILKMK
jgi:hypothetical protein